MLKRFVVLTVGYSGVEKTFCAYDSADAANKVAARLNSINCPARVIVVQPRSRSQPAEIADSNAR